MTGLDVIGASNLLRHLCRVDLISKHGKGCATYYLPAERFLESLPAGVIPPGFEGKTSMSDSKPSMSGTEPSMSGTKPSMSDGKSHMLPAHIEGMIDQLGGKADDAAMRSFRA